jgi:hypothetical protein
MKAKRFLLLAALSSVIPVSAQSAVTVTFDDLPLNSHFLFPVPSNYQGLAWSSVDTVNAILDTNVIAGRHPNIPGGLTGEYFGMVSLSNVAILYGSNAFGIANSEIDSPGTNFNFISAYLTGYWNSNLNIQVQGFNGSLLAYDTTVVVSATSPTLFTFDYFDINRLYFNSYGGDPAFGISGGEYVSVMDNFTFDFIPEPSSLLLTILGVLMLCTIRRRATT